jgi:hypothetical protein
MRLLSLVAMLAFSFAASAEATTILNFDSTRGRDGGTGYVYGDYQEQGFTVTADECTGSDNTCFVTSGSFANSLDKTGAALATQVNPATVTVLKDDGGPFVLDSLAVADFYGNIFSVGKPTDTVRFTFTFADGTFTTVNYDIANTPGQNLTTNLLTFDLAPLTAFSFIPLGGAQIQFDNITLSDPAAAAVPEASTWAMMIVGFGLTGTALRRRRRAIAFA